MLREGELTYGLINNDPPPYIIVQCLPDQLKIFGSQTAMAILLEVGPHVVEPRDPGLVEAL